MRRRKHTPAWDGGAVAAAFWVLETILAPWVFHEGTVLQNLLPRDPNEAWMRTVAASLIMAFGLYARVASGDLDRAERHERTLEHQLDEALARMLADFIPICAKCKSIRDAKQWVRIEEYVTRHTGSHFSHGLCPSCLHEAESELER